MENDVQGEAVEDSRTAVLCASLHASSSASEVSSVQERSQSTQRLSLRVAIVVAVTLLPFPFAPERSSSQMLDYMVIGFWAGSIFAHAIGAAFVWAMLSASGWRRRGLSAGWLGMVLLAVVAYMLLHAASDLAYGLLIIGTCLLATSFVSMLLYTGMRALYGITLRVREEGEREERSPADSKTDSAQFTMRDLLIFMMVAAVILACGRSILGSQGWGNEVLIWGYLAISSVLQFPALLMAALLPRHAGPAVLAACLFCGGMTWLQKSVWYGAGFHDPSLDTLQLSAIAVSAGMLVLVFAVAMRSAGYRLQRNTRAPA